MIARVESTEYSYTNALVHSSRFIIACDLAAFNSSKTRPNLSTFFIGQVIDAIIVRCVIEDRTRDRFLPFLRQFAQYFNRLLHQLRHGTDYSKYAILHKAYPGELSGRRRNLKGCQSPRRTLDVANAGRSRALLF